MLSLRKICRFSGCLDSSGFDTLIIGPIGVEFGGSDCTV